MSNPARVFRALSDQCRRDILLALRAGELPAGAIAARFAISAPSVSRHLAILKAADLIAERRDGNRIFYRLVPERLALCLNQFLSAVCPLKVLHRKRQRGTP